MQRPTNFNEYISFYPAPVKKILKQLRATIKEAAPEAEEVISYGMPAFKMNGMLAWIGAHTNHTGLYPGVSGIAAFKKELSSYKNAKGSVQFPFDEPLPTTLIRKIITFRVKENKEKAALRKQKK